MNNNKTDLLCHLESHLVHNNGMIHQDKLSAADRKQIELWKDKGFIELKKIPLPDRHDGPVIATHKIRFSEKAWELAHKFRRKIAQRNTPTLKDDNESTLSLVKNGKPPRNPERETENDPSADSRLPSLEDFQNWLQQNNAELTNPQRQTARIFFKTIKEENLIGFWTKSQTGKSWLLKAIDQYITQLQK